MADILLREFVTGDLRGFFENVNFPTTSTEAIAAKTRLYQLASVLIAVLVEAEKTPSYVKVQKYLEQSILPPTAAQGMNIYGELKDAMADLSHLFDPTQTSRQMKWSQHWLETVGVDESNPATLTMFSIRWLSAFTPISKSIKRIRPT